LPSASSFSSGGVQYIGPAPLDGDGGRMLAAANGASHENPAAAPRAEVSAEALPPPPGAKGKTTSVAKPAEPPPSATQILAAQNRAGGGAPVATATETDLAHQTVDVGPARGGQIFVQVGAFSLHENAHKLAARLSLIGPVGVSSTFVNRQEFFRVRLGPYNQVAGADQALQQVLNSGMTDARIVVE
uniref:SPOR domain-containing protein n=1 Tax=Ferrovibrio sp. TaxID=1917215 RepID=UPI00311EE31D